ncbi:hypothetical protein [Erythrobacter aureus]|uniref:Type 4 secretion system PilS N-terminal domain-containing protein n=1 Tax=Erythrobacter aureus TaxID=2182384 RepID=A0A345YJL0_9SPHN|nr:hypothetical protein [Erythrobacter aureus]AXK44112.1 hypothetical protein DVR09_16805 [Erythrobacter aureus]
MSQILLGIIGVTIFIISAIAGVSYLGPTFMQSTTDSEAGVGLQGLSQISMAIHLREMETQSATEVGFNLDGLAPDYLPEIPENPFSAIDPILVTGVGTLAQRPGEFVLMPVETANAQQICNSISRQGGGSDVAPNIFISEIVEPLGCFRSKKEYAGGAVNIGDFVAYVRI